MWLLNLARWSGQYWGANLKARLYVFNHTPQSHVPGRFRIMFVGISVTKCDQNVTRTWPEREVWPQRFILGLCKSHLRCVIRSGYNVLLQFIHANNAKVTVREGLDWHMGLMLIQSSQVSPHWTLSLYYNPGEARHLLAMFSAFSCWPSCCFLYNQFVLTFLIRFLGLVT